ncbi:bifunctional proline dehydrogenase/L-glutamate gamma-semialdehyde dehydrogenase PutA [Roseomonas sp. CCTCC AB2023176]|uniref:bifunctional proline dehydrogenase/L-glutamate gamma-semialdehyde dehydrogenase PutA n=1 Tax=Roseomonas sp. CCTCC AB2023176 TaxID=3342640 RepID=UPI0035DCB190
MDQIVTRGSSSLAAPYAPDDAAAIRSLFARASLPAEREARVDAEAGALITAIRGRGGLGGVEELLREYALDTREGLALMVLAEALLRIPDARTADALIEDRLGAGDFAHHEPAGGGVLVNAAAWALGISTRIVRPGETPEGVIASLTKRIGSPAVREATRAAMRVMGGHFVLGQTIGEALDRAGSRAGRVYRYSFDMLGEGARTANDAARYATSYADAIAAIGRAAGNRPLPDRPGISVKLSALHPRYEAVSRDRVMAELVPVVRDLARAARAQELNFTVDAEEQDRLELSLDVIAAVAADEALAGWDGFGLAVQAYGKRAGAVVDWIAELAHRLDRRFMVRLVKGAYWDAEVKRAQERGLDGYPVWTRKAATDLAYLTLSERMLALRPRIYPQFATHNALTVASILERAGGVDGYEFQRLHGMGDALYAELLRRREGLAVRTYAPVGGHADLLAYLVRRLLENGANSSFVSRAADPDVPVTSLLVRPAAALGAPEAAANARLPLPAALYPDRRNSRGVEFGDRAALEALLAEVARARAPAEAAPLVEGRTLPGTARDAVNPATGARIGRVMESTDAVAPAVDAAHRAWRAWNGAGPATRAAAVERAADLYETNRGRLIALLVDEGGKTLDDAVAELREAVDFLRYYAVQARALFRPEVLPGPTGESNVLSRHGRGAWACISPWNFPLAIFTGQVAAALAAGNTVLAKPAEQTPLVAAEAVALLHRAGVPPAALHLMPGAGDVGAALVAHPLIAGVAFTGSTEVAWRINRALAAKDGPIVPLIAETGGINAMVVDATALPEAVADDAVTSAFRSAGQRCSALRLLCVQEEVADKVIAMIAGAAREMRVGDPADPATHLGPVIDAEAKARLDAHIARMSRDARVHLAGTAPPDGHFVAPHLFELRGPTDLAEEVFGPVLHVVRWRPDALDALLRDLASTGYGLTLGVQSRNEGFIARVLAAVPAGNAYVNRSMIGAVVGTQPFGGSGLSGTGPKAGGPDYLRRFAGERVVTINTAAAGGNAALLAAEE